MQDGEAGLSHLRTLGWPLKPIEKLGSGALGFRVSGLRWSPIKAIN